jgi:hypothetical protein
VPRELLPNALQDAGEAFGRLVRRTLVERITLAASPSRLAAFQFGLEYFIGAADWSLQR